MGVTDQVKRAREEWALNMHFEIAPGNMAQFETMIRFCGMERFHLGLKIATMWPDFVGNEAAKYQRFIAMMRYVAPGKNPATKPRTLGTAMREKLDRESLDATLDAAARDRCAVHRQRNCEICEPLDASKLPV